MNLVRNFATVGAFTALSRVMGFIRDVLIAAILGAGPVADAFLVAFKLPNLFRRLFAEGAFNSAFVPLYARVRQEEGAEGSDTFASNVLSWLCLVLLAVTALAEIFTPLLVWGLAPGFDTTSETFFLSVEYTRILFPYLAAMSLVAFLSGILNTLGRFAAAAAAPVMLNFVLIGALYIAHLCGMGPAPAATILSVGVFVAGVVQAVLLVIAAWRMNVRLRFVRPHRSPRLTRLVKLGIPGVLAGGITQINIVAGTIIASYWAGAVSHLYYADRLYQLPLGIVGIAIGVALLPDLSRRLRAGDEGGALWSQNRALEFALLLTLPAAAALVAVPLEIVVPLFERGEFTREAATQTAAAVAAYGVGLPAFVLIKVLSPGYFAREDTATPTLFACLSMVVNVGGSVLFAWLLTPAGMPHVGIALATSLAGWVNAAALFVGLLRRGDLRPDADLMFRAPAFLAASLALAVAALLIAGALDDWFFREGALRAAGALAILVAGSFVVFAVVCELTGAMGVKDVRRVLRRGGAASPPRAAGE